VLCFDLGWHVVPHQLVVIDTINFRHAIIIL
jgi:hypothetical protein